MPPRMLSQAGYRSGSTVAHQRCNRRFFSNSNSRRLPDPSQFSNYPPEHPKFIDIPRPIQPQAVGKPLIKGRLPVPREVFPSWGPSKTSPDFLAATTPERPPQDLARIPDPRIRQAVSFKQRQAEQRRQNFRQGISELHQRKKRIDGEVAARSSKILASNRAARDAPEREDEMLTKASILQSDLPPKKLLVSDSDQERNLAIKRERTTASIAQVQQERKEMLHTLYVNAQNFITTGEQLDEAIDQAFDDMDQFRSQSKRGFNVWNFGEPDTTAKMLGKSEKSYESSFKAVDDAPKRLTEQRMKRLGEELTGGKS